jgi:hypothetical protein
MALVGIHNHWGTFDISILKMKTLDVKSLLEQSHSKFYLYNIITCNKLEKGHAYANPQVFKF